MKKALAILSALALVGSVAFAEDGIKVGGWGRIGFIAASDSDAAGTDPVSYTAPSWANGARVGVNFSGSSENVGFNLNLDSNGNEAKIGDQAKIWVKLSDMFKFELGKIQGDVLRGKIGDFGVYSAQLTGDEDGIFKRFNPSAGLLLNVTPVEGLYLGAALDTAANGATIRSDLMFRKIQVGAGYTIPSVGLVRAQYRGTLDMKDATTYKIGSIDVGFNLTSVENLNLDAAATIGANAGDTQSLIVAATYKADALFVGGRVKGTYGKTDATDPTTTIGTMVDAKVEYAVASPLSVGLNGSFGFTNASATVLSTEMSMTTLQWQVGPYAKVGYGQGFGAIGFTVAGGSASSKFGSFTTNTTAPTTWAVPIYAEYWF